MIGKLVRAILGGLFLAGFVHVLAVLLIPSVAPSDAVARAFAAAAPNAVVAIPADGSVLPDLDPAFVHAVCPFEIAHGGAVEVSGTMPDTIWSFAVVSGPTIAASFERSSAVENRIDLVIADADTAEGIRLARNGEGNASTSYAPVPDGRGFILLRAFTDADHPAADVRDALTAIDCGPAQD